MELNYDYDAARPTTSSGRPGTSSGARPGTSSGRPGTSNGGGGGVPAFGQTAPASRPGTGGSSTGRRGKRGGSRAGRLGTANTLRGMELNPYGMDDLYEDDEEWDDDGEESDDGDVFAFKHPEIGPSAVPLDDLHWEQHRQPAIVPTNSSVQAPPVAAPNAAPAPQTQAAAATAVGEEEFDEEEETFYYDEKTGAVYDSEGKLVETNPDFDASQVLASALTGSANGSNASADEHARANVPTLAYAPGPRPSTASRPGTAQSRPPTSGMAAALSGIIAARTASSGSGSGKRASVASAASLKAFRRLSARDLGYTASGARAPDTNNGTVVRTVLSPPPEILSDARHPRQKQQPREQIEVRQIASGDTFVDMDMHHNRSGSGAPHPPRTPPPQHSHLRRRSAGSSEEIDEKYAIGRSPGMYSLSSSAASPRTARMGISSSRTALDTLFTTKQPYKGAYTMDEYEGAFGGKKYNGGRQRQLSDGLDDTVDAEPQIEVGSRGLRLIALEVETEEDSPFPEVRASVSNVDDPSMPVSTFRVWFLGILACTIAGAANMVFSFRYPAPQISPILILLLIYPLGKLCAAILPYRTVTLPARLGGYTLTLNSGFFNVKEHSIITQMANVSISQAFALNAVIAQDSPVFYHDARPVGFAVLFTLSSVLWSFGLAGMCKRLLVWPASMIWPQNLTVCTILNTLHAEEEGQDGRMTRFKYFLLVLVGAFCWNFVPNVLFAGLSVFNWVCWIAPENTPLNVVFGASNGMGLSLLTFDWNQISYVGSPLVTPWWAVCNMMAGFVLIVWVAFPALYFSNVWHFAYMPMLGGSAYDRFGSPYKLRAVLDDNHLSKDLYENYSPLYIPVNYFAVYWCGLALATTMIVHTALYHGRGIMQALRNKKIENDDIHATMMRRYKEVPDWWYGVLLVLGFVMAVVATQVYAIGLPIWALILALLIPTIYIIPSGFVFAMTGQIINANLVTELISGYAMPSKPFPNLVFKAYSLSGIFSGLTFVQDLKLGHYMKVPPRMSFSAQLVATIWVIFVQIGVKVFMFARVPLLCRPNEPHHFTCPTASVYYTSSIVWGVIGPRRMFGPDSQYSSMYWALLVGALAPLPFWFLARYLRDSKFKFVSMPLILSASSYIPPGSGINYTSFFLAAFIFQYIARRRFFSWWSKYNFVTSAALDMGTALSMLLIFFALQLPRGGSIALQWWGNTVPFETADYQRVSLLQAPPEGFGPTPVF